MPEVYPVGGWQHMRVVRKRRCVAREGIMHVGHAWRMQWWPARPATPARYGLERHSSVGFNTTGEVGYTAPRYGSPVRYGSPQAQTDKHPLTQCLVWCCAGLLECGAAPLKCCDDGRK